MRPARRHARTMAAAGLIACIGALALVSLALAATSTESDAATAPGADDAAASLPAEGVVHFGEDLGGVRIGASGADVIAAWGAEFGSCPSCDIETWYFTYEEFTPEGVGVELLDGRVRALYTLWQPAGWRSGGGLRLGASREEIPEIYLELPRVACSGYEAYVHERRDSQTVLYIYRDELWAFGLMAVDHPVCR